MCVFCVGVFVKESVCLRVLYVSWCVMVYGSTGCVYCVCLCVCLCLTCVLLVMYDVMLCGLCFGVVLVWFVCLCACV